MSQENVEIVRSFLEQSRAPGWRHVEMLAEDVVYRPVAEMPDAGEYRGREGYRGYVQSFFEGEWTKGVELGEVTYRDYGERVVVRAAFAGRGRSSGIGLSGRIFQLYTLRGGEIVRIEDFLDREAALAAAGAEGSDPAQAMGM